VSPRNRLAGAIGVWLPVCLAATGVLVVGRYNLLPATAAYEAGFFAVVMLSATWSANRNAAAVYVLTLILTVRFAVILAEGNTPPWDALQAHKWLFYLIGLGLVSSVRLARPNLVVSITKVVIALALVKYTQVVLQSGLGARPGLFAENNYELSFLSGMLAVTFHKMGRRRYLYLGALAVTALLSGSRSGAIGFIVVTCYVFLTDRRLRPLARYVFTIIVLAALYIPVSVFRERANVDSSIDRVKFARVFFSESESWTLGQWLFGTHPLTPLSSSSCGSLSYYERLFSADGQCYSVIMHMFLLRVIFDFGLVGLVLAFAIFYRIMRRAGVARSLALVLLGVAIVNSSSVSGLNNVYVIWPAMMAILSVPPLLPGDPEHAQSSGNRARRATRSLGTRSVNAEVSRRPVPRRH
jgi:hypothetical protein